MNIYLDRFINMFNFVFCFFIFGGLLWAVLSRRVKDGIVVKAGLISMAVGFGGLAYHMWNGHSMGDIIPIQRAMLLVNAGMGVVFIGVLFKTTRSRHPLRRKEDYIDSGLAAEGDSDDSFEHR